MPHQGFFQFSCLDPQGKRTGEGGEDGEKEKRGLSVCGKEDILTEWVMVARERGEQASSK